MHPGISSPLKSFRPDGHAPFRAALARWLLLAAVAAAAIAPVHAAPSLENFERATLQLYGRPLQVYCTRPRGGPSKGVLVLYSTGDGGWKGLDRELLSRIAAWGYPAGGFDSGRYLKDLGYSDHPTTPKQMGQDFFQIIAFTLRVLNLPPKTPVVLAGWSRGAGLSVVAAGQPETQRLLAGVIGVALTETEENVVHHKVHKGRSPGDVPRRELVELDTYQYLPHLGTLPVAILQSTNDGYVPAEDARRRLGPDTPCRRLFAIESSGHSFGGGRDILYQRLRDSLAWMESLKQLASISCGSPK